MKDSIKITKRIHYQKSMELPETLLITDSAIATDGGSCGLICRSSDGTEIGVTLTQHRFLNTEHELPGRLYWYSAQDHFLIPIRSDVEKVIVALVKNAEVEESPWADVHAEMRDAIIEFIESEEYIRIAQIVEQNRKT